MRFLDQVFDEMYKWPQHTWMVLTKRPERMLEYHKQVSDGLFKADEPLFWPQHIQFGVSVESGKYLHRITDLLDIPAARRFVSLEPLLGPIHFPKDVLLCDREENESSPVACIPCPCGKHWMNQTIPENYRLECLDWVIVGPETGPQRRPCWAEWIRGIIEQCDSADVPPFVKAFPMPDGTISNDPAEWPEWARRREYPK